MSEVPRSGEEHGNVMFVGGGDHLIVTDGATWLGYGGDTTRSSHLNVVGEWEEGVGCENAALCLVLGDA